MQDRFPNLMKVCRNPKIKVVECWSNRGWNFKFRRNLNDWKMERVSSLLNEVEIFVGTTIEPDKLRWRHTTKGSFSVKICTRGRIVLCKRKNIDCLVCYVKNNMH